VSRRHGFTLIEAAVVVVVIGAVALIGFPKLSGALAKNNLRSARTTLANMFTKARAVSMQSNRSTWINFNGNTIVVTSSPRTVAGAGTVDTIGAVERLDASYGATVTAPVASVAYDPRGFGSGLTTPLTFLVTRSGKRDSVIVDGLGRVRK
jgi:prepilin-type N-terminal cleavage/methylation domain-containing protein